MNGDEKTKATPMRPPDELVDSTPEAVAVSGEDLRSVRPVVRSRIRITAQPALAAIVVVLVIGAVVAVGSLRGPASQSGGGGDSLALTNRVDCFGQGPGQAPDPAAVSTDGCPMMAVPPAGYGAATWTLDPSVPYSAGATEIHVLVEESSCDSGQTAKGRIGQNVQYRVDAVVVTLAVRLPSGPQTCQGNPPTPYAVHVDQPVGARNLDDDGRWPAQTMARGGQPVVSPTPTPQPSNWHMPMDCSGEGDGPGSFKAASMGAKFDVYCAVLPAGWQRESMSGDEQVGTVVTVVYRGPNGETFGLREGDFCVLGNGTCATAGTDLGKAMFGDREGQFVGDPSGADFALYVAPGQSPSWEATGKGMTAESFRALTAALIVVGK
jgi:Methyl-CpG binding domain